ncbi:Alpha/Beta hydrolase protein [Microdochium bolleyi]|uniref:Alpha/Beta hydrolase protein n=1 Tax=Microdochium bolleyi TaxID=196109 RepID=A0A136IJG7_9PEZI|nr:Alpha/Beta hydrolase protein [Microdochium bolleyi]
MLTQGHFGYHVCVHSQEPRGDTVIKRTYYRELAGYVGCNTTALDDAAAITCLQSIDTLELTKASQVNTAEPVPTTFGCPTQDDITLYMSPSIAYAEGTYNSIRARYPWLSETSLDALLVLYPVAEFPANTTANRTSESYRVARIWRDVLMVCQPMYLAQTLSAAGSDVYLCDWNQTVTGPALAAVRGLYGGGVLLTGEFANTFGNVSVYVVNGYPFDPAPEDFALQHRGARSWSTFANTGRPRMEGKAIIWIAGGPNEGLSAVGGLGARPEMAEQKLHQRCAFTNSPDMIEQLRY